MGGDNSPSPATGQVIGRTLESRHHVHRRETSMYVLHVHPASVFPPVHLSTKTTANKEQVHAEQQQHTACVWYGMWWGLLHTNTMGQRAAGKSEIIVAANHNARGYQNDSVQYKQTKRTEDRTAFAGLISL
ncbi:unnamed protein product [Ectocarpus sp. 13 AM-2016]